MIVQISLGRFSRSGNYQFFPNQGFKFSEEASNELWRRLKKIWDERKWPKRKRKP